MEEQCMKGYLNDVMAFGVAAQDLVMEVLRWGNEIWMTSNMNDH